MISAPESIRWTYARVDLEAARLAAWLRARHIGKGSTVGVFLPRSAYMYGSRIHRGHHMRKDNNNMSIVSERRKFIELL